MKDSVAQKLDHSPSLQEGTGTPRMSIIIISYNTRQMTLDCIASVYAQTQTPFELIVVDNASSDGSAEAIAKAFPDLHLIAEDTNHGFAPAHDIAMAHATAPWVLLLNPDTLVLDRALDNLMQFAAQQPEAKIWGGRTVFADGRLNPYSCWRKMSLWTIFCRTTGLNSIFSKSGLFNSEEYAGWDRGAPGHVDIVTGCLFLLRRETWDHLKGFDPVFTMYGEEADLCLRAIDQLGARPMITPQATIVHYGGASEKVPADRIIRVNRAKAELIKRHFPALTRKLGLGLFRLFPYSRMLATRALWFMTRRAELGEKSAIWGEIWARRAEWDDGFPQK